MQCVNDMYLLIGLTWQRPSLHFRGPPGSPAVKEPVPNRLCSIIVHGLACQIPGHALH